MVADLVKRPFAVAFGPTGAAIEAALDVGRPRGIRVTDLAEQVIEEFRSFIEDISPDDFRER